MHRGRAVAARRVAGGPGAAGGVVRGRLLLRAGGLVCGGLARALAISVVAVLVGPGRTVGQRPVEAAPHLGLLVPVRAGSGDPAVVGEGGALRRREVPAVVLGARVAVPLRPHAAVEASVAYSPVFTAVTDAARTVDLEGGTLLSSLRLRLSFNSFAPPGRWVFYGMSGVGWVVRHGGAWRGLRGTQDLALLVGAGMLLRPPEAPLAFRLDLEDFLSWADHGPASEPVRRGLYHGLVWSMALVLPITR